MFRRVACAYFRSKTLDIGLFLCYNTSEKACSQELFRIQLLANEVATATQKRRFCKPFNDDIVTAYHREEDMAFNLSDMSWDRPPKNFTASDKEIRIITEPYTDLWQRTYYGFRNDNAPVLQFTTEEKFFSFVVRTQFESKRRFDQCGIVMYLNGDNWLKASVEYENGSFQRLGSVVTNHGYSDWATTDISASIDTVWYRLNRRNSDYLIEYSLDGTDFKQMRICHLLEGGNAVRFGIYACSPENSSFEAVFTEMKVTDCVWARHC